MIPASIKTNEPRDLQTLHGIVCKDYAKLRKEGGRADSPYLPFFINTMSALNQAKQRGDKVSPTITVLRDDGSQGVIDLVELFTEMGFMK